MLYQLVILFCFYLFWKLWLKKKSRLEAEPPELSGWYPIVGHAHKLAGHSVKMFNSFVSMSEECLEKGGVTTFRVGTKKIYGIADPQDSLTIFNTCLEKSDVFKFAKPFLGNGLIIADVERWHLSRKLLNPAFSQKVLDSFVGLFNSQAQDLVNNFATEVGKPFDHERYLRINNLETICSTSFEVEVNEYRDIFSRYIPLLLSVVTKTNNRIQKFWLHSDFIYNMTQEKREYDKEANDFVELSKTIIQKKRMERKNKSNGNKTGKPKKFIDLILDVAEELGCFTDEQIREETDNIVIGGHDTTAATLTFALTLLGSHIDVQEKLYEEISQNCGKSNAAIEKDDLSKLVYTEAVLKETLRLYPIGLILPRYADKDVKLKNYTIKANHDCYIMMHGVHRHRMWGADANQFRPDRWLQKETLPDPKYYGAFGLGRRSCLGKVYAMMSMKIILAHVVRRYRVSSDVSKIVVALQMTSRPESGYFISLEERE